MANTIAALKIHSPDETPSFLSKILQLQKDQ